MQQQNKAQLQTFAETKPLYAPHIQREKHGGEEKGRSSAKLITMI